MYKNSIKSSSNELLGKPSLHDPYYKLFFEQLFGDFTVIMCIYVYNVYSILREMYKRNHIFCFFKIHEIRYQDIRY